MWRPRACSFFFLSLSPGRPSSAPAPHLQRRLLPLQVLVLRLQLLRLVLRRRDLRLQRLDLQGCGAACRYVGGWKTRTAFSCF